MDDDYYWQPPDLDGQGSIHDLAGPSYKPSRLEGLQSVKNLLGGVVRVERPAPQVRIGFHSPKNRHKPL